jgi:toluene monooxygenase system ferredoxin subunit
MKGVRVATLDDLWPGEMRGISIRGARILLVNLDGAIHAYEDRCAHKAAALSKGKLEGHVLTCWVHEWRYDLATGEGINPCGTRLRRLPLRIEGDDIVVEVTDGA